jgi:hypothetical protein
MIILKCFTQHTFGQVRNIRLKGLNANIGNYKNRYVHKILLFVFGFILITCSSENKNFKDIEIYSYKWELKPDSSCYDLVCKLYAIIDKDKNCQLIHSYNSQLTNKSIFKRGLIDNSRLNNLLDNLSPLKCDTELLKNYVGGGPNPYLLIKLQKHKNDSLIAFTMADSSLSSNMAIVDFYNYISLINLDHFKDIIDTNSIISKKNRMDSLVINHVLRFIPPPPPIPIEFIISHKIKVEH